MSSLRGALGDYVRVRRALGFVFEREVPELERFVGFLEQAGAQRITIELALRWARMPQGVHPYVWRKRLGIVRGFARYLATIDPASEIPPTDLLPARQPRLIPHIYTPEEIVALMMAARSLPWPLRAATCETVIGLLASTGLRLREALALDRADVDLQDGVLLVRGARHHKQREVPLHPSTTAALRRYAPPARPPLPRSRHAGVLCHQPQPAAHPGQLSPRVPETDRPGRPGRSRPASPTPPA